MDYNKYEVAELYEISGIEDNKSEMSDSQLFFLCGLIKEFQPKKIVEVGVSAGGTTVNIIKCINRLGIKCDMYSVDLLDYYYRDNTKPCGYMIEEINANERSFHRLLTGEILPKRLGEIGNGIDFLILDTVHLLPGEVLDFLAIFPFLKENAVVVLHDIALHHLSDKNCIATNVLFQTVVAEKYLNNNEYFPNIAAFRINEDTKKYIFDVFCCLTLPWDYIPDEEQIETYSKMYSEHYGSDALLLWKQARSVAKKCINRENERIQLF